MSDDLADRLLREFLEAQNETESQLHLGRLLETAQPVVRRIVASALRGPAAQDPDDVVSDTIAHMLRRLVDWKADPFRDPIRDFAAYVATSAYNHCHERLRQSYPARNRLRNQLLYLLNHHPDFALWRGAHGESVCGYRKWIGQPAQWQEQADSAHFAVPASGQKRADVVALVGEVFRRFPGPLDLDSLVDVVAPTLGVEEQRIEPLAAASGAAVAAAAESQLELRMSLRQLWDDIRQLPQRQRTALLLSLRDVQGREILSLLPLTRTASMKEIAEALQVPLIELAARWGALPLDDVAIGKLLGASRQQVIKLRRLAREKLRRSANRRQQAVTPRMQQNLTTDSASSKTGRTTSR